MAVYEIGRWEFFPPSVTWSTRSPSFKEVFLGEPGPRKRSWIFLRNWQKLRSHPETQQSYDQQPEKRQTRENTSSLATVTMESHTHFGKGKCLCLVVYLLTAREEREHVLLQQFSTCFYLYKARDPSKGAPWWITLEPLGDSATTMDSILKTFLHGFSQAIVSRCNLLSSRSWSYRVKLSVRALFIHLFIDSLNIDWKVYSVLGRIPEPTKHRLCP